MEVGVEEGGNMEAACLKESPDFRLLQLLGQEQTHRSIPRIKPVDLKRRRWTSAFRLINLARSDCPPVARLISSEKRSNGICPRGEANPACGVEAR